MQDLFLATPCLRQGSMPYMDSAGRKVRLGQTGGITLMANGKPPREKVANRDYVDASGQEVEDEQDAMGVKFEHLSRGETVAVNWSDFSDDGKRLIGLFGLKTWIGNLFNQKLDIGEINDRLDKVKAGEWPERQGMGGPRYDQNALAQAIATAKGSTDVAPFLKRVQDDSKYASMAMRHPEVLRLYNQATGRAAPDLSAL